MSEKTFLQLWLGGAFGHVDGDLDFLNGDNSSVVTTSDYAEIVSFIEQNDQVLVDLMVGETLAGFALQFPIDAKPVPVIPSFTVGDATSRWHVYLTSGPADDVRTLIYALQPTDEEAHSVERVIPLPVRDIEMSAEDMDAAEGGYEVFPIEDLLEAFFPDDDEGPTEIIGDAGIYGHFTDELAALPIRLSYGKEAFAKEWKSDTKDIPLFKVFEKLFSKHVVGKKDGTAIVTGTLGKSKRRTKNNVIAGYMIGLDVDNGSSLEETFARIRKAGLTAILYTTHSHGTRRIEIAHDKFYKWAEKRDIDTAPTTETIRQFMRETMSYVSSVVDNAEFIDKVHEDGLKLIVESRPIDKFRVLFPLDRPFVYAEQEGAHKDVIDSWSSRVLGLGRMFGVEVDRAARDPSRLFYLPRHSEGSTNYKVMMNCGKLLRFEDIPTASTSTKVTDDPFDQAATIMGATGRGEIVSPTLGLNLKRWAAERADGFDIVSVFKDHCDDRLRVELSESKYSCECPFDDDHSNPGDTEDQGTFIHSAGDDAETFAFHCSHAGCAGRDRLDMLQKAMQEGWFPDSVLDDEGYDTLVREESEDADDDESDDGDGDDSKSESYTTKYAEAVKAIQSLSKDATRDQREAAYEKCAVLNEQDRRDMAGKLAKKLELMKGDIIKRLNILRQQLTGEMEDTTPDPSTVAKRLKSKLPRFKKSQKPVVAIIPTNMTASIDHFVEVCNGVNSESESLFIFGELKARCTRSVNNEYKIEALAKPVMRSFAKENMNIATLTSDGGFTFDPIPEVMAEQACMSTNLTLHKLDGFSDLPYFTKDGKLVTSFGYDRDGARILRSGPDVGSDLESAFAPSKLLEVTHENLEFAKKEVFGLFSDFPFKDHAEDKGANKGVSSRAHLLAMMLQPLVRSMFSGNSPFYLIDKPSAGTGATLLVSTAMRIATGVIPGTVAISNNDEELRKSITARFMSGSQVTFFDNLIEPLNSPHLANLATSAEWEDRVLGQTHMTKVPNRMQVIVAGNNVRTSDENARRVLPITLDLEDDPTEVTRVFKIPDLKGFVDDHQEELFKYLILMVQYWLKHRPAGFDTRTWHGFSLPSFEQYCAVMGSLLETIGVEGFGGNVKYVKSENSDKSAWNSFLYEVALRKGAKGVSIDDFTQTTPFNMEDLVATFMDWGDKDILRVSGDKTGVRPSHEEDRVAMDFARVMGHIRRGIFRLPWQVTMGEFVGVKVRLENVPGTKTWILRRIGDTDQEAA